MDLVQYVGKLVKIDLVNNYFYQGVVLKADSDSLDLKDLRGNIVTLTSKSILYIREIVR